MAATTHAKEIKDESRKFITIALFQLLDKKNTTLSALTISAVCKRAGLSRMAFYRNFDSLDTVIREYFTPLITEQFHGLNSDNPSQKIYRQIEFFDRFSEQLTKAKKQGYEPIIQEIFTSEIAAFYGSEADSYWITFIAAGTYALWRKWLLEGRKQPLEKIHEILVKIQNTEDYSPR